MNALQHVVGYVWCDKHCCVHNDTLNPYGYIEGQDLCTDDDHRALYMEPDDMATPEPVRSNPIPLTVRRHTEQSMAIWRANLLDAMPADMLQEDRERIADSLLEFGIKQGNELRRKRIISKLMLAAEEMEVRASSAAKIGRGVGKNVLKEWSDLMADAAEEIRSVL